MSTPPQIIGYVRVSSAEQAEHGISLDAQRTRLRAYCEAHGLTLLRVEEDAGVSAKTMRRRPALQRALSALRAHEADGLAAVRLDRLSRTTRDVLDIVTHSAKQGWTLHSIDERLDTGTPQGRFVVTILGAMAQLEREQVAARTRAALDGKGCTPHVLRHAFACHFLEAGAAVTDLQALLGHASLATTSIYARMVDRRTRESVAALRF